MGLAKGHAVDARCISGNPLTVPIDIIYHKKAVRTRNRQIHKATVNKGGVRKLNQTPKYMFGYQLFDRVVIPDGRTGFIFGRRSSGYFDIRTLRGEKLTAGIRYQNLKHIAKRKAILTESEGRAFLAPPIEAGVSCAEN